MTNSRPEAETLLVSKTTLFPPRGSAFQASGLLDPRNGVFSPSVLTFLSQVSTGLPVASICWVWPCSLKQENKQGIDTSNPKPPSAPTSALGRGHSPAPTAPGCPPLGVGASVSFPSPLPKFLSLPGTPTRRSEGRVGEPLPGPPSLPSPVIVSRPELSPRPFERATPSFRRNLAAFSAIPFGISGKAALLAASPPTSRALRRPGLSTD